MNNEIDYLRASNGSLEAVRATVNTFRASGATSLKVHSLIGWPQKFVATTGVLNETTGLIEPSSVLIFKGHINGTDIIIDEFAPGYTDRDSVVGEVVMLKPNTFWADTWADIMLVSHNQDGTLKFPSGGLTFNIGGTFTSAGYYVVTGKSCTVHFRILLSSGLSGNYNAVEVPVLYDHSFTAAAVKTSHGEVSYWDASASTYRKGVLRTQGQAAGKSLFRLATTATGASDIGTTNPFTWASGDVIEGSFSFKIQ